MTRAAGVTHVPVSPMYLDAITNVSVATIAP